MIIRNISFLATAFLFLLINKTAFAQAPLGGESISEAHYNDSLTSICAKTAEGCPNKGLTVQVVSGSRMYITYTAYGKDLYDLTLLLIDNNGKQVKKYGNQEKGINTIELDSNFSKSSSINILFTTKKPDQKIYFTADVFYASPEALAYQEDANLCWKLYFLIKQSNSAFRFITIPTNQKHGTFNTTTPIDPKFPEDSRIVISDVFSIYYESKLGLGTKEEAIAFISQTSAGLPGCLGTSFKYKTTTDPNGMPRITCTYSATREGEHIRSLEYANLKQGIEVPKYKIEIFAKETTVDGHVVYQMYLTVSNLFYQY